MKIINKKKNERQTVGSRETGLSLKERGLRDERWRERRCKGK